MGTRSNRSAIGARVSVTLGAHRQTQEVMSGSSYYSQNDLRLHFGLGKADAADALEVAWPSGLKETFRDLPAGHLFVIQEGEGDRRAPPTGVSRPCTDGGHAVARALPLGLLLLVAAGASAAELQFTDVTKAVGIDFKHESSATSNKYLIETMGGGVALFDYDQDGRLDVFFTNGARLEDPMPEGKAPDKSDRKYWNRLYHQNADGTFSDVTEKAGVNGMPQNRYGMGVAVGDYDNDDFPDLYVTNYGANTLYRNNRDGTFSDVTKAPGSPRPAGARAPGSSTRTTTAASTCS